MAKHYTLVLMGIRVWGDLTFSFLRKEKTELGVIPLNMGYPLNTVGDDVYFSTTIDGKKGYYSSSHEGGLGERRHLQYQARHCHY